MSINIPASIGMPIEEIDTPCLLVDLDAFERNVAKMGKFVRENGFATVATPSATNRLTSRHT